MACGACQSMQLSSSPKGLMLFAKRGKVLELLEPMFVNDMASDIVADKNR